MDIKNIDRYLNQCEAVLLRDRHPTADTTDFPLRPSEPVLPDALPPSSWRNFRATSLGDVIEQVPVPAVTANKSLPLMPGEKLKSYVANDTTGTLPRDYEIVLDAAAQVIGVEQGDVAGIVELYESRLDRARLKEGEKKGVLHEAG